MTFEKLNYLYFNKQKRINFSTKHISNLFINKIISIHYPYLINKINTIVYNPYYKKQVFKYYQVN